MGYAVKEIHIELDTHFEDILHETREVKETI